MGVLYMDSNHPGLKSVVRNGMQLNEFRPPNISDDLCLLVSLYFFYVSRYGGWGEVGGGEGVQYYP